MWFLQKCYQSQIIEIPVGIKLYLNILPQRLRLFQFADLRKASDDGYVRERVSIILASGDLSFGMI